MGIEQFAIEEERSQCSQRNLETMRWRFAVRHHEILHVQQVRKLVIGPACRPARFGIGLHGKAAEQQTLH